MSITKKDGGGEKTKDPKKKQTRYQYPAEAIDADDPLSKVIFFGRKFKEDERDSLLTADLSMTMDQVSQLTFTFLDMDFKHLKKGIFVPDIPVKYEDLFLDVGTVGVGSISGHPLLTVKCRPRIVRKLKRRTGPKVLRNASPSEFIKSECHAIDAKCVVQDSSPRNQVSRDVKREKGDPEPPSSYTTFKRLAAELGFVFFESMNVIYFGKPSWLLDHFKDNALEVNWNRGDEDTRPVEIPACNRNEDTEDDGVSITFKMYGKYGRKFRPGMAIKLSGIPTFDDYYIITAVDYSLLNKDVVSITAGTPVDPPKMKTKLNGLGGSRTGSTSLRGLLQRVGFNGTSLDTAVAIVMAESGADAKAINRSAAGGKWGPACGLFQIRALVHPEQYGGLDAQRVQSKLFDPQYNAAFAFKLSGGGKNWSAWSAYTNGSYRKYYKAGADHQITGWSPPAIAGSSGASGQKSATAFITYALRQVGDRYVFGAEADLHDPNPSAFDCSELVQWAAAQAGVYIPDGSSAQIAFCRGISVDLAIRTRGALLYKPGHIAISLGDGRTVEALNPGYGVATMSATQRSFRWTAGGLIPGMNY